MDYSMFERPNLPNVQSLKFYPEDYNRYQVPCRHKNLPPDFESNFSSKIKIDKGDETSIKARVSSEKRSPIYVHNFAKMVNAERQHEEGDCVVKKKKSKAKPKLNKSSVIKKLEESYWATWKPEKNEIKSKAAPEKRIKIIKEAPRRKVKVFPEPPIINVIKQKSQEIQTDDLLLPLVLPSVHSTSSATKKVEVETFEGDQNDTSELNTAEKNSEDLESKFLKHTDSFILNSKKHNEEKQHFEQPKSIRLYKNPGKLHSRGFVKGGSYPLKSCLKQESSFARGNIRLGRPGSPIIISSTYSKYSTYHRK